MHIGIHPQRCTHATNVQYIKHATVDIPADEDCRGTRILHCHHIAETGILSFSIFNAFSVCSLPKLHFVRWMMTRRVFNVFGDTIKCTHKYFTVMAPAQQNLLAWEARSIVVGYEGLGVSPCAHYLLWICSVKIICQVRSTGKP